MYPFLAVFDDFDWSIPEFMGAMTHGSLLFQSLQGIIDVDPFVKDISVLRGLL